jgi:hypothetical protein
MITPAEIRIKAERKYISVLQSLAQRIQFSKLIIRGDKSYSKSLPEFEKEIQAIVGQSKEKKGYGYSIDYQTIKTKTIGTQSLPTSIYFDTEKDFLKYLGREKEVEIFKNNFEKIISIFPELKEWAIRNPLRIIQCQGEWESILKVCSYFKSNPCPNLYIRELPIKVHTKFIERNQGIIKDVLDVLISDHINKNERYFEKRFNLKYSEPQIRFKILDKAISHDYFSGLDDIAIPVSQFERLKLPVSKVLIVENKTTLYTTLTLPKMEKTIAIFGSGYSVFLLKNVEWFKTIELLYWGDIDVQGFEILSQFRASFPLTKSILMDQQTFDTFFEDDLGTPSDISISLNLTIGEQKLFDLLKENNWRLEQEKIPFGYVNELFENETD